MLSRRRNEQRICFSTQYVTVSIVGIVHMFTARGSEWHGLSPCAGLVRRLVFLSHRRRTFLGPSPHRDISVQQGKARCNSDQLWHHSFVDQRLQLFTVSLLPFIIHLGPLLTRLLQDSTRMNTLDPNQIRGYVLFRLQRLAHPPPCPPFPIPILAHSFSTGLRS